MALAFSGVCSRDASSHTSWIHRRRPGGQVSTLATGRPAVRAGARRRQMRLAGGDVRSRAWRQASRRSRPGGPWGPENFAAGMIGLLVRAHLAAGAHLCAFQPVPLQPVPFMHAATHLVAGAHLCALHHQLSRYRQAACHLLQPRRRDPSGRVARVGVDHALQQQARLLDVADLGICTPKCRCAWAGCTCKGTAPHGGWRRCCGLCERAGRSRP